MIIDDWHNCYPSSWKGKIVPTAFQHPAKFSSRLIRRIYEHVIEEGWANPGDVIVDPFGGIALGALDAMRLGLAWRGVELEAHFAEIGNQNIAFWNQQFSSMPRWTGDALLLQGDSRNLVEILAAGHAVVSSPPYADGCAHTGGNDTDPSHIQGGTLIGVGIAGAISSPPYAETRNAPGGDQRDDLFRGYHGDGNYSAAISSPPYTDSPLVAGIQGKNAGELRVNRGQAYACVSSPPYASAAEGTPLDPQDYPTLRGVLKQNADHLQKYGTTDGQLGSMRATESGFQAAISSPPFAGSTADGGWQMLGKYAEQGKLTIKQVKGKKDKAYPSWDKDRDTSYAPSDDNLGNAKASDASFRAAISSPPYQGTTGGANVTAKSGVLADERLFNRHAASSASRGYGESNDNLGNQLDNDFWLSARLIIEQVYHVLQPGGHAIWVVKDYVKNKQRVPFCDQWRELCETVGFIALHEHHAMLVRHNGTSLTLDGERVEHKVESKSFFRRLSEKKGSPRIDWETVLCMEKPL